MAFSEECIWKRGLLRRAGIFTSLGAGGEPPIDGVISLGPCRLCFPRAPFIRHRSIRYYKPPRLRVRIPHFHQHPEKRPFTPWRYLRPCLVLRKLPNQAPGGVSNPRAMDFDYPISDGLFQIPTCGYRGFGISPNPRLPAPHGISPPLWRSFLVARTSVRSGAHMNPPF